MAKKYYAVAKGKVPGIYMTWDACKAQVSGFSGALYKSFLTVSEAETFLARYGEDEQAGFVEEQEGEPVSTKTHLVAYVDGSYEQSLGQYAYGCVLVLPDELVTLNGCGKEEAYVSMRNVAGEILGSEQAIRWAVEHGYLEITIYYDYEGIEKWANDIWKANKEGTKRYKEFVAEQRAYIKIHFSKVAAHTGVRYNEMADQLAKAALGL